MLDLSGLLDALSAILCTMQNLALSFLAVIVMAFNGIIVAAGAFIEVLVIALPSWNPGGQHFDSGIMAWVNWLLPVDTVVTLWTTGLTVIGIMMGIRAGARWVKLL